MTSEHFLIAGLLIFSMVAAWLLEWCGDKRKAEREEYCNALRDIMSVSGTDSQAALVMREMAAVHLYRLLRK